MQLFLADPPYAVLNKIRDNLSATSMDILCQMAQHFVKPGGTVLIFCSIQQFAEYSDRLKRFKFVVQSTPLHIINSPTCKNYLIVITIFY